jgi:hypothetical protein
VPGDSGAIGEALRDVGHHGGRAPVEEAQRREVERFEVGMPAHRQRHGRHGDAHGDAVGPDAVQHDVEVEAREEPVARAAGDPGADVGDAQQVRERREGLQTVGAGHAEGHLPLQAARRRLEHAAQARVSVERPASGRRE